MISEYLEFFLVGTSKSGKTLIFHVKSKSSGTLLGTIKWYGAWRQYCFYPEPSTIFNRGCLKDIENYIEAEMQFR